MKLAGVIALIGLSFGVSFYVGHESVSTPLPVAATRQPATSPALTTNQSTSPIAQSLQQQESIPQSADTTQSFESMARTRGLLQKSRELERAFPNSVAGQKLAQLSTLFAFVPVIGTPESAWANEQVQWLKENSREGFAALTAGVPRLSAEYSAERQYLIQLAAKLDVAQRSKMAFLEKELNRSRVSDFNALAALSAMMETLPDSREVEMAIRRTLRNQKDPKAREQLLSLYSAGEPSRAKNLRNE